MYGHAWGWKSQIVIAIFFSFGIYSAVSLGMEGVVEYFNNFKSALGPHNQFMYTPAEEAWYSTSSGWWDAIRRIGMVVGLSLGLFALSLGPWRQIGWGIILLIGFLAERREERVIVRFERDESADAIIWLLILAALLVGGGQPLIGG